MEKLKFNMIITKEVEIDVDDIKGIYEGKPIVVDGVEYFVKSLICHAPFDYKLEVFTK